MNAAIVAAGLRGLLFVACAGVAFAVQPVPASDPFGKDAGEFTFTDFCQANPTVALPVGEQPAWVEWLVVEAPALPDQPTPVMLKTGRLVRQVTRLNRCAATEQWQVVDRAPDGRKLDAPQRVGSALFTRLLPDGDGRVSIVYFCDWVRPSGWIENAAGRAEVVCERRSYNSRLIVNDGEWVKFSGSSAERITKTADGKETVTKIAHGFYLRVLTKPDPSWSVP